MRAQFVFSEVWIGLRRNLTMTVALIVVVAISLSLLGTGLLFVKQVDNTRTYWQTKVQLAVYLCSSQDLTGRCPNNGTVTPSEINTIRQDLLANPDVTSVQFYSAQQNYRTFKQEFKSDTPMINYTPAS